MLGAPHGNAAGLLLPLPKLVLQASKAYLLLDQHAHDSLPPTAMQPDSGFSYTDRFFEDRMLFLLLDWPTAQAQHYDWAGWTKPVVHESAGEAAMRGERAAAHVWRGGAWAEVLACVLLEGLGWRRARCLLSRVVLFGFQRCFIVPHFSFLRCLVCLPCAHLPLLLLAETNEYIAAHSKWEQLKEKAKSLPKQLVAGRGWEGGLLAGQAKKWERVVMPLHKLAGMCACYLVD